MPRKRGLSSGRLGAMREMFQDGMSPDDIARELDLNAKYVKYALRKLGFKIERAYSLGVRDDRSAHYKDGFSVVYDPLDLFGEGAFFPVLDVNSMRLLGTLVPGMRLREKATGYEFVVIGDLDSKQEIVRV